MILIAVATSIGGWDSASDRELFKGDFKAVACLIQDKP